MSAAAPLSFGHHDLASFSTPLISSRRPSTGRAGAASFCSPARLLRSLMKPVWYKCNGTIEVYFSVHFITSFAALISDEGGADNMRDILKRLP